MGPSTPPRRTSRGAHSVCCGSSRHGAASFHAAARPAPRVRGGLGRGMGGRAREEPRAALGAALLWSCMHAVRPRRACGSGTALRPSQLALLCRRRMHGRKKPMHALRPWSAHAKVLRSSRCGCGWMRGSGRGEVTLCERCEVNKTAEDVIRKGKSSHSKSSHSSSFPSSSDDIPGLCWRCGVTLLVGRPLEGLADRWSESTATAAAAQSLPQSLPANR
jgi:hypothetical protein